MQQQPTICSRKTKKEKEREKKIFPLGGPPITLFYNFMILMNRRKVLCFTFPNGMRSSFEGEERGEGILYICDTETFLVHSREPGLGGDRGFLNELHIFLKRHPEYT